MRPLCRSKKPRLGATAELCRAKRPPPRTAFRNKRQPTGIMALYRSKRRRPTQVRNNRIVCWRDLGTQSGHFCVRQKRGSSVARRFARPSVSRSNLGNADWRHFGRLPGFTNPKSNPAARIGHATVGRGGQISLPQGCGIHRKNPGNDWSANRQAKLQVTVQPSPII